MVGSNRLRQPRFAFRQSVAAWLDFLLVFAVVLQ